MVSLFCGNCYYCIPNEYNQTDNHRGHICEKYRVELFHGTHHPKIMRTAQCLADNFNYLKCPICNSDIVISKDDFACMDDRCKLYNGVRAFVITLNLILLDATRIYFETVGRSTDEIQE